MGKLYRQEFCFLPSHKCNLPPWSLHMHLPSIVKPLKSDFCLYFKEAYVCYVKWFFFFFFFREWDTRGMEGPHRTRPRCMWAAGDEQRAWLTSRRPHMGRSGGKAGQPPCPSAPVPRLPEVLSPSTHCSEALPLSGLRPCMNPWLHLLWPCPSSPFPSDARIAHQFLPDVW